MDSEIDPIDEEPTLESTPNLFSRIFRWARYALWTSLILGGLVLILSIAQLSEFLMMIHPYLAKGMVVLMVALCLWALWRSYCYMRIPKVVLPPRLPLPSDGWTPAHQKAWREFSTLWLKRQISNPHLPESIKNKIPQTIKSIRAPLDRETKKDPVAAAKALTSRLEMAFDDVISPLDAKAGNLIRRAAWQVSVSTAVFPNALMDALITLTRSIDLVSRLAHLYYGRPGLGTTLKIVRDVFGAAIIAGFTEEITTSVGGVISDITGSWSTRLLGPVGQGLVNGLLTMRIGNAAQRRCRSFNAAETTWTTWSKSDYKEAANRLLEWAYKTFKPAASELFKRVAPRKKWWRPNG